MTQDLIKRLDLFPESEGMWAEVETSMLKKCRDLLEAQAAEIEALKAERDEYQQAADKMAMEHKVERDALRAELEASKKDAKRLNRIAYLIGSIFVHGGFVAETVNERELEKLLRENGTFWENLDAFDNAMKEGEA